MRCSYLILLYASLSLAEWLVILDVVTSLKLVVYRREIMKIEVVAIQKNPSSVVNFLLVDLITEQLKIA